MKKRRTLIRLAAVCLLAFSLTGCGTTRESMTDMKFQNAAEKAGYEVMDSTEQFAAYDHIESASIAIKDNDYQVEFYTTSNSASAASMFQTSRASFETTKGSKTIERGKSGENYQSYSLLTNRQYMYVCQIDNTLVYVDGQLPRPMADAIEVGACKSSS